MRCKISNIYPQSLFREFTDIPWHFRTIGMGTINYRAAAKRLASEVFDTKIFKSSIGYDEKYLKIHSPVFWQNHRKVLKARTPGFGWWLWKPEFINLCLESIPPGEGLMYLDAGSFVSSDNNCLELLIAHLNLASKEEVIGSNSQNFIEEDYSSFGIMEKLNLKENDRKSSQFYAGFMLLTNTPKSRIIINSWQKIACENAHSLYFSKPTKNDSPTFVHNMYDQAILSCLFKINSVSSITIGDKGNSGCIRVIRHRFGFKISETRKLIITYYKTISYLSKVRLAIERRLFIQSLNNAKANH